MTLRYFVNWKLSVTLLFTCVLLACSSVNLSKRADNNIADEPSVHLLNLLKTNPQLNSQDVASVLSHIREVSPTRELILSNIELTQQLLLEYQRSNNLFSTLETIGQENFEQNDTLLAISLVLFPHQQDKLLGELNTSEYFLSIDVKTAVLLAGLDPNLVFSPTAALEQAYRLTPLINSASITLFGHDEDTQTKVWFRKVENPQWKEGLSLQWEPINSALSGSIVHLQADTDYELKVEVNYLGDMDTKFFNFTTRANEPPIDPDKIYYLSDIYNGGTLDLDALGIAGAPGAWAKIIGDGVVIEGDDEYKAALMIGTTSYVMFEDITVRGGSLFGIHAKESHHLWFKGCDISEFGRFAGEYRDGVAYENTEAASPINYDAGMYLYRTGVVVIEDCEIHDPNLGANSWEYGHPRGASALVVNTNHPIDEYDGQYIVRNNAFYGTDDKRFNDVIESRSNVRYFGGFMRDSAIHDNYLAYANDDIIELDGGQSNVLFYNNEIMQAYCGVSLAPNMLGPSYIFHNYIHNLGDSRGLQWAAFKMGGLFSAPAGKTLIFENKIDINANGIATANLRNDRTFWVETRNNIFINRNFINNEKGYGIRDVEGYELNRFINDVYYNTVLEGEILFNSPAIGNFAPFDQSSINFEEIIDNEKSEVLNITNENQIPNFSITNLDESLEEVAKLPFDLTASSLESFGKQDKQPNVISIDNDSLILSSNTWKAFPIDFEIDGNTRLTMSVVLHGNAEIVGIGFENNNVLTESRVIKIAGLQNYGTSLSAETNNRAFELSFSPKDYVSGDIDRIVFILDNDKVSRRNAVVEFTNISFITSVSKLETVYKKVNIDFSNSALLPFDDQDRHPQVITSGKNELTLSGNTWKAIPIDFELDENSKISMDVDINGPAEIVGIGLEDNNTLTRERIIKISGLQRFGVTPDSKSISEDGVVHVEFSPKNYKSGNIDRLVFILDNDRVIRQSSTVTFKNIKVTARSNESTETYQSNEQGTLTGINVGIQYN